MTPSAQRGLIIRLEYLSVFITDAALKFQWILVQSTALESQVISIQEKFDCDGFHLKHD